MRGLRPAPLCTRLDEVAQHLLGDLEIGDHAVLQGGMATMWAGVRPIMRLASSPTARGRPSLVLTATTEGSFRTMPGPDMTSVFAVPQVDRHVPRRAKRKKIACRTMPEGLRPREVSVRLGPGRRIGQPRASGQGRRPSRTHKHPGQGPASERGKEDVDLPLGRLRRVRSVDQVLVSSMARSPRIVPAPHRAGW